MIEDIYKSTLEAVLSGGYVSINNEPAEDGLYYGIVDTQVELTREQFECLKQMGWVIEED